MSEEMLDGGAVREIADLARDAGTEVISIAHDGRTVPVLAAKLSGGGIGVSGVKKFFDEWREAPERREGVAVAASVGSFIGLTNRHKGADSAIFAHLCRDGKSARLMSVIDYDGGSYSDPDNQRHRIAYNFPFSREWLMLASINDKAMTQVDFAEFIEDNIHLFAVADGDELKLADKFGTTFAAPSDLLDLSRGLAIRAESVVKEIRNLASGEAEIAFEERHVNSDGQPLRVPGLVMFKAPIFDGGEVKRFVARLRYRRAGGSIQWRFVLYRPIDVIRAAVEADATHAQDATALPLFWGSPERDVFGKPVVILA